MRKVTRLCEVCDTPFFVQKRGGVESRYCSKRCGGIARRAPLAPITCANCEAVFIPRTAINKYCSWSCKLAASTTRPIITVTCQGCATVFTVRSSRPRRYCTQSCQLDALHRLNRDRYAGMDRPVTAIERAMAEALTANGIPFDAEVRIDTPWGSMFLCDFVVRGAMIVIECDGDYWHSLPNTQRRDRRKNAYLRHVGYTVLRFWERDIKADLPGCIAQVVAKLDHG